MTESHGQNSLNMGSAGFQKLDLSRIVKILATKLVVRQNPVIWVIFPPFLPRFIAVVPDMRLREVIVRQRYPRDPAKEKRMAPRGWGYLFLTSSLGP